MAASSTIVGSESQLDALDREEQAFWRMHPELLRDFEGEYVGLFEGKMVGHGQDDEQLADELYARLGYVPFLIARVEREPTVVEVTTHESAA